MVSNNDNKRRKERERDQRPGYHVAKKDTINSTFPFNNTER